MSTKPRQLLFIFLCSITIGARVTTVAAAPPRVDVILWFDTEDYLLPADDDAAKRLADMLYERGIRATFKVVGEKARVLEKRGRRDVIDALKKHDIGYHSNFHSVHPAPAELPPRDPPRTGPAWPPTIPSDFGCRWSAGRRW